MSTTYPTNLFRFSVDFGGGNTGFQEVSGLEMSYEVNTYRDGTFPDSRADMQSPGRTVHPSSMTLSRGKFQGDQDIPNWFTNMRTADDRRTVVINLYDELQQPVITWTVYKAWPSRVEGLNLSATGNEIAIETVELTFEGFDVQHH
jgi:phage tail-like protein